MATSTYLARRHIPNKVLNFKVHYTLRYLVHRLSTKDVPYSSRAAAESKIITAFYRTILTKRLSEASIFSLEFRQPFETFFPSNAGKIIPQHNQRDNCEE